MDIVFIYIDVIKKLLGLAGVDEATTTAIGGVA